MSAPRAAAFRSSAIVVVDASVVAELLLASQAGRRAMARLVAANAVLHAPEFLDIEVLHVLRRAVSRDQLTSRRADHAIRVSADALRRHAGVPLLQQQIQVEVWRKEAAMPMTLEHAHRRVWRP